MSEVWFEESRYHAIQKFGKFLSSRLLTQMLGREDDPFRVYSERKVEVSHFVWSPYMDLLSALPVDEENPSISVLRLINDKHTNSPLLFSEKLPFPGTTTAWVPDKRSLAVGDTMGNVFVYDAERQRTIELQKVHKGPISCLDWLTLKSISDDFSVSTLSGCHKLPAIYSIPPSFHQASTEWIPGQTESGPPSEEGSLVNCDSLANSDRVTILSVLGESGRLSLYYGGSIPICEISVPDLTGVGGGDVFVDVSISPDLSSIAVLSTRGGETTLHLLNSSILRWRLQSLIPLCRVESRIHWLLRQLNAGILEVTRAVSAQVTELNAIVAEPLEHHLGKTQKSVFQLLDYLSTVLTSRLGVLVAHLQLAIGELAEMAAWKTRFGSLIGNVDALRDATNSIHRHLEGHTRNVLDMCVIFRVFFSNKIPQNEAPPDLPPSEESVAFTSGQSPIIRCCFDDVLEACRDCEAQYVAILSGQRRAVGTAIEVGKIFSFQAKAVCMRRMQSADTLALVWVEEAALVLTKMGDGGVRRFEFQAPENSIWAFPNFYKDEKICALLKRVVDGAHDGAQESISVCLLDTLHHTSTAGPVVIRAEEYGYAAYWEAQQLPAWCMGATAVCVSAPRGLCSVYADGKLLTLDLEPDEGSDEEGSEASGETPKQGDEKQPNRRRLRRHDSLIEHSETRESPETLFDSGCTRPLRELGN